MIQILPKKQERAFLVGVKQKGISEAVINEHLAELEELTDTAGALTILKIYQEREHFDSAFYIGKGKAEEIKELIELNEIDIVIFDDDLSPVQVRNLEKLFDRKVVDRSGLILDIFASRAKTREARTQVELAQLEYMLPRLTRAWTHLSKQYGGIGTKGPGETQIETDRRIIRTKIAVLKEKLKEIEKQRAVRTAGRNNIFRISLAGYTNAGKSTLFNLLTNAGIFAEDKLFATLDSTTRALQLDKNFEVLISDTVGFIRKLPPKLIASFKSTLEEVRESDLIIQLIDMSHPFYEDHIRVVDETLKELDCGDKKILKVFNKVDAIQDIERINHIKYLYPDSEIVSAVRGIGVEKMLETIKEIFTNEFSTETMILEHSDSKTLSALYQLASVQSVDYDDDKVKVTYTINKRHAEKLRRIINGY